MIYNSHHDIPSKICNCHASMQAQIMSLKPYLKEGKGELQSPVEMSMPILYEYAMVWHDSKTFDINTRITISLSPSNYHLAFRCLDNIEIF
jgi:hypothetical protein